MCRAMAISTHPPTAGPTPRTLWLVFAAPWSFSGAPAIASSPARTGAASAQAPAGLGACNGEAQRPSCSAPISTRSPAEVSSLAPGLLHGRACRAGAAAAALRRRRRRRPEHRCKQRLETSPYTLQVGSVPSCPALQARPAKVQTSGLGSEKQISPEWPEFVPFLLPPAWPPSSLPGQSGRRSESEWLRAAADGSLPLRPLPEAG